MKLIAPVFVALFGFCWTDKTEAAVQEYDLIYTYTLEVTDAWIDSSDQWTIDQYTPLLPAVGTIMNGVFQIGLWIDGSGGNICEKSPAPMFTYCELHRFNPLTGDIGLELSSYWFVDEWSFQDGSGERSYADDGPGLGLWRVEYDIVDYSVSGLPGIATMPVPPAAPMLAAGFLLLAGMRGLRRRSST